MIQPDSERPKGMASARTMQENRERSWSTSDKFLTALVFTVMTSSLFWDRSISSRVALIFHTRVKTEASANVSIKKLLLEITPTTSEVPEIPRVTDFVRRAQLPY